MQNYSRVPDVHCQNAPGEDNGGLQPTAQPDGWEGGQVVLCDGGRLSLTTLAFHIS